MLNTELRQKAVRKLERAVKANERVRGEVQQRSIELFEQRQRAAEEIIAKVETFVNRLANSPKEFDRSVTEYRIEVDRFDRSVRQLKVQARESQTVGHATRAAGAAAGVGIAAFGPTAALAIATTFGTASTGTAISALSGAAATNAALAWLGGGAVAAGGGGMASGNVLLAMAGPVGWTVGGLALLGSAGYLRYRNAQLAEQATLELAKVRSQTRLLQSAGHEIAQLSRSTTEHCDGCTCELAWLTENAPEDYVRFEQEPKERLAALINHIHSLGVLLKKEVTL